MRIIKYHLVTTKKAITYIIVIGYDNEMHNKISICSSVVSIFLYFPMNIGQSNDSITNIVA